MFKGDKMFDKFLGSLSSKVIRFKYLIIFIWLTLIATGLIFGLNLSEKLVGGGWNAQNSDSTYASAVIDDNFKTRDSSSLTLIYHNKKHSVFEEGYNLELEKIINYLSDQKGIESIDSILDGTELSESLIGKDNHTTISRVQLNLDEGEAIKVIPDIQKKLSDLIDEDNTATLLGLSALWAETSKLSQEGIAKAQVYAFPIILIILLLVFRTVVSAAIPLVVGVASILVSLGVLYFVADYTSLSMFVMDSAMMVGLGVGIDFSLIFVIRFREELEKGRSVTEAITTTMKTSGKAILFSGIIIATAMSALFMVDIKSVNSIALGIILVVFVLVLVSLTLLPSILTLIGNNINKLKISFIKKKDKKLDWYKWTKLIMKRPIMYLVIGVIIHLILTVPATDLKMGTPDARMLPKDSLMSESVRLVEENYGVGFLSPISIVLKTDKSMILSRENYKNIFEFTASLNEINYVDKVDSFVNYIPDYDIYEMMFKSPKNSEQLLTDLSHYINEDYTVTVIEVIPKYSASSKETKDLVLDIREKYSSIFDDSDIQVFVGGETATGMDSDFELSNSLIPVIILTLSLIFIILLISFRSVFVPLKAIIMNIFSLGATYGILVILFQTKVGSFFGIEVSGFIQSFIPVLLLSLLFSLSTDYEVFLLNRVKEEYNKSKDNEESVAVGISKTAPMITGAALMMISVFLSFSLAGLQPIQQLGLGMAIGIIIDATLIRLLIVPASMKLMGKWNWWFPKLKEK